MSEQATDVQSIVTPTRLVYQFTATGAQADFLRSISEGRLIGHRCSEPPSASCAFRPRTST
jgi:uncharacterized OB-fold protein